MSVVANNPQAHNGASFSYTVPSVSNAVLVVYVFSEDVGNDSPITGVTVDGSSAGVTEGVRAEAINGSNSNDVVEFYLTGVSSGAKTIAAVGGSGEGRIKLIVATLSGAAALARDDSGAATLAGAATTISDSLTASAAGLSLSALITGAAVAWAPDYGSTIASENTFSSSTFAGLSSEAVTSGAVSTGWTGPSDFRIGMASTIWVESGGASEYTIAGATTVDVASSATLLEGRGIAGETTITAGASATMAYSSGNAIAGTTTINVGVDALMLEGRAVAGDVAVSVGVDATMLYVAAGSEDVSILDRGNLCGPGISDVPRRKRKRKAPEVTIRLPSLEEEDLCDLEDVLELIELFDLMEAA